MENVSARAYYKHVYYIYVLKIVSNKILYYKKKEAID